jgi:hypothetical protein
MRIVIALILLLGMSAALVGCSTSCGTAGGAPVKYPQVPVNPGEQNNPATPRR